jgi:vitamin B12 transporter
VSESPTLRLTSYINADRSRARGFEGQVTLDAGSALGGTPGRVTLNGSVTHMIEAVDLLPAGEEPIRNIADWKATGSITVSNGSNLSATALIRFNGDRLDTDNSQGRVFTNGEGGLFVYDRFTTVDLSARYRVTPNDTLRLEVSNLFDIEYYEKADYPMPGRTAYVRYVRSF